MKSWLLKHDIKTCSIDLNKNLTISNPELVRNIKYYFGQPKDYLINENPDSFSNIDTIYNFQLLLRFMYPDKYKDYKLNTAASSFYNELTKQLDLDSTYLLESGYSYFGFSAFVSNICYSILLATTLKSKDSKVVTFFGGCSTAYSPIREFLLKSGTANYVLR